VRIICETSELRKDHVLKMADSLSQKVRGLTIRGRKEGSAVKRQRKRGRE